MKRAATVSAATCLRRAGVGLLLSLVLGAAQAADITVSAAASLTNAFKEMAVAFEARHPGRKVLLNFAASDTLLAQISKGAPVDVFASADQETMDRAEAQKLLAPGTRRDFAGNALVLVVPADSRLALKALADLRQTAVTRVAIGNPSGVPAGRYTKGALEAAGLWSEVEAKAVFAQNVRQTLDYVARGEADAGFVYNTDAASQKDKVNVAFEVRTETAIRYPIAAVAGGPGTAVGRSFVEFVSSPQGQALLARHGFLKP